MNILLYCIGRYQYKDGVPRPDCVEVVIREIIDALIYGINNKTHTYL